MIHPGHRMVGVRPLALLLVATSVLASVSAWGQGLFRIVGPDGRVTYADRPPADAGVSVSPLNAAAQPPGADGSSAAGSEELRQAAARYPVTLYSTPDCEPCALGRDLLKRRGVPYGEKTVATAADLLALQRLTGTQSLPVLTIGGQLLRGYSEREWDQYLDLAGYPKTSVLPANHRAAPPVPLAPPLPVPAEGVRDRPASATGALLPPPLPAPTQRKPLPGNPGSIRF